MSIRKTIRTAKYLLIFAGLAVAGFKASRYLPSPKRTESAVTVAAKPARSSATEYLKPFLPEDRQHRSQQILYRRSYVVSYNRDTRCPNWVLWELTRDHADGDAGRPDYAFHEDMEVPAPRALPSDYRGCGYDRGHMCPAGDNKWDADAMYDTFLLTNICPQDRKLNSGLWNRIEMKCRHWAKKHGRIFIVCGPLYLGGDHRLIGDSRIVVPDAFFKVVLCLEGNPRGIAFICRNASGSRTKDYYVNTINEAEIITGYRFFPGLDGDVAVRVKDEADLKAW